MQANTIFIVKLKTYKTYSYGFSILSVIYINCNNIFCFT